MAGVDSSASYTIWVLQAPQVVSHEAPPAALLLLASVGACKPPQPVQQPASRDPCIELRHAATVQVRPAAVTRWRALSIRNPSLAVERARSVVW